MVGVCQEQEKLTTLLEEYMKDIFPIQELNLKVTAVAGYQSGYTTNMPRNLVHEKVSSNFLTTITEEEDPLNVYYIIEFSSPENIAKKIQRQDFEDLYFLPDDVLGKIERRVVLINYWNKEDIGKITPEHIRFGKKQQESFYYDNTAVYAKEIKIINIDLFKDGGVQYISNPEPIKFGKYTFISNVEIEDIDTCPEKIKDIDNEHYLADNKEIVGCHYIKTQDKDNHIKVYIKKEDIGLKTERYGNNVVFVKEDSYYGISYPDGNVVGEYYYTTVKSSDSETNRFFLIENEKH